MRALLGLAVGLALADSSIVTLALPDILGQFDVAITSVAWVLTSFNLVLALLAVPAAYVSRRRPREAFVGRQRRVRRRVARVRARALLRGARRRPLRAGRRCGARRHRRARSPRAGPGGDERALRVWVAAGILGAALGPAAGGILTQLLGWESIFLAQVPLALVLLFALRGVDRRGRCPTPAGRPSLAANAALLLVAGGLVAALFLVVLLLVDGWGMSPAAAGVVVTVMPLAAIAVGRLRPSVARRRCRASRAA